MTSSVLSKELNSCSFSIKSTAGSDAAPLKSATVIKVESPSELVPLASLVFILMLAPLV